MSMNQDPKAVGVAGDDSTSKASAASSMSEVHPFTDDRQLRNTIFAGIRSKQLEIKDGAAHLLDDASAVFVGRLAAAARESIVLTAGITPQAMNTSAIYIDKSRPTIADYLRELRAATIAIDDKRAHTDAFLGNPVTGVEFGGKDYEVPYRKYENGAIYVRHHGTFEVHGDIYRKYVAMGAEAGFLGFPETDEQSTALNTGRFNHFQGGSIYWTQRTGAWSVHGPSRDKWLQLDAERGYLGFPISDVEQTSSGSGSVAFFEHGSLFGSIADGFTDYPESVILTTKLHDNHVKCTTEFGMNSRGDWFFKGHLHNDGFAGNVTTVATTPKFTDASGRAFVVSAERSLGGTLDTEDRNDDWAQAGTDDFILDNWDILRNAGARTVMETDTTFGDVMNILLVGLGSAVVAVGAAIFGVHIATQKWCGPVASQSRDPLTGETKTHIGWRLVDPGEQCPAGYQ